MRGGVASAEVEEARERTRWSFDYPSCLGIEHEHCVVNDTTEYHQHAGVDPVAEDSWEQISMGLAMLPHGKLRSFKRRRCSLRTLLANTSPTPPQLYPAPLCER